MCVVMLLRGPTQSDMQAMHRARCGALAVGSSGGPSQDCQAFCGPCLKPRPRPFHDMQIAVQLYHN